MQSVVEKKAKDAPLHAMEALGGRMSSCYSFLTSVLDGVSGQRHAPAALYPRRKEAQYPLDRRLGWPQSRSDHSDYMKTHFLSAGNRTSIARSYSP
jgi:hypothetical protein